MKTKHNKKRNTAFIFEALVREMTKTLVSKDVQKKKTIAQILKEHFSEGSILDRELQCYRALSDKSNLDPYTAEKMIHRTKQEYEKIDKNNIFQEQSKVIKKINKQVGPKVFANFVPNYKSFATIAQIFSDSTPIKHKVLMERKVLSFLTGEVAPKEEILEPVDNFVVGNFVEKYNGEYQSLLPEQKSLLNKFIFAFGESDADFRLGIYEELKRIREAVKNSLTLGEVLSDPTMRDNTEKILEQIDQFNVASIGEPELMKILKLQTLVREYESDASDN